MKTLFFALLLFAVSLQADISHHLKKAVGKDPAVNKIKNIDLIYMINLDKKPDKFQKSIEQLHPYGIYPYRFSAVSGWELSLDDINDVGVKYAPGMEGGFMASSYLRLDFVRSDNLINTFGQTYFVHCFARGTVGIALSHTSVLQDAYDSGYETIWVMEDDISVIRDPRIIPDFLERLDARVGKGNWDILFTDRDFKNRQGEYVPCSGFARRPNFRPVNPERFAEKIQIDNDFRKIGARFGATSMIIRRSGIKKILEHMKTYQVFLPYDMDLYLPADIQIYTVNEDIIGNLPDAISNNGKPPV